MHNEHRENQDMAFEIIFNPKSPENPAGPMAYIAVDIELRNEEGMKVLTPECTSAGELNAMADMLIQELEKLKREANTLFNVPGVASVPPPEPPTNSRRLT